MSFNRLLWLPLVLCTAILLAAESGPGRKDVLFQVSTLDALSLGIYDSSFSIGQLRQHGDFGVGTYEGLDGEMVALDGHFYHVRSDGTVSESGEDEKTPFAVVTKFKPDVQISVNQASCPRLATFSMRSCRRRTCSARSKV